MVNRGNEPHTADFATSYVADIQNSKSIHQNVRANSKSIHQNVRAKRKASQHDYPTSPLSRLFFYQWLS